MLPKGFVLKKDRKRMEKEAQAISIEELIEKERANLDTSKLTKVTLETFVAWKKKKLKEKALADKKEKKEKEKKGTVSGRDLFLKDPAMLARHVEEDDGEDFDLTREQDDDDGTKVGHRRIYRLLIDYHDSFDLNFGKKINCRCMKSSLTNTVSWKMVWTRAQTFSWPGRGGRKCLMGPPLLLLWTSMKTSSMMMTWTTWKET